MLCLKGKNEKKECRNAKSAWTDGHVMGKGLNKQKGKSGNNRKTQEVPIHTQTHTHTHRHIQTHTPTQIDMG